MDPTFPSFRSIPSPPRENEIISFLFHVSPNFFLAERSKFWGKENIAEHNYTQTQRKLLSNDITLNRIGEIGKNFNLCSWNDSRIDIYSACRERERKGNWWDC